jgi:hypothetical protein
MRGYSLTDNPTSGEDTSSPRWLERILWLCPLLSLLGAAALLWLFGFTFATSIVAAILVACPIAVAWALIAERLGRSPKG